MGLHDGHRERMKRRFLRHGLASFDDHNVLELLLFYAIPRRDTNALAHRLMDTFGTLDAVFGADAEMLMSVEGMGENAAALIRLVPETARRYLMAKSEVGEILLDAESAGRFFLPRFINCRNETVYLACLDAKMKVLDCRALSSGSVNSAHVDVRGIVQMALLQNASAVILAHNHTSGIALPSREDETATLQVQQALKLVGVELLDHIIVAGDDFVSLADNGLLRAEW